MLKNAFDMTPRLRRALGRTLAFCLILIASAFTTAAWGQSFLGTIRGTVSDPQGQVVSGVTVLIIDEATGAARTLETDAQGRYETPNLRPGTYRVEVVSTNFKKFERTGVLVRAAGTALVDITLDLGNVNETVTVAGDALNNITLESQAIARGLDEQQLHDLPRNSRDIQSFLLLNPNVVGGSGDIQFLGGKTYGVSYIQDGQASTNAIFGTIGNSAPGLDAVSEITVLSNSYSAEYRRPGRCRRHHQARREQFSRDELLRLQQQRIERPDVQPEALRRPARGSECRHSRAPVGRQHRRPADRQQSILLRELRGLEQQVDIRRRDCDGADRRDAERRFPQHRDCATGSADRAGLPGSGDSNQPDRSGRARGHGLLLPAAQSVTAGERIRAFSAIRAQDKGTAPWRHQTRLSGWDQRFDLCPGAVFSIGIRTQSPLRRVPPSLICRT